MAASRPPYLLAGDAARKRPPSALGAPLALMRPGCRCFDEEEDRGRFTVGQTSLPATSVCGLTCRKRTDTVAALVGVLEDSVTGLFATLEIYRLVSTRAAALALRNWAVLASALAYWLISSVAGWFAPRLGLLGGFVLVLIQSACIASFLYLVEMMVRTSRATLADFRRSFGVYLWDVIGVRFVLWLFFGFVGPLLLALPEGGLMLRFVTLLLLVLFNAVPELIYLGHHSTLALLSESYRFIADNWLEWFPPNILMLAVVLLLAWVPVGPVGIVVDIVVIPLFVYFAMVTRGFLFLELSGTSRRGRIFRYRSR